jgi:hypothetical protein
VPAEGLTAVNEREIMSVWRRREECEQEEQIRLCADCMSFRSGGVVALHAQPIIVEGDIEHLQNRPGQVCACYRIQPHESGIFLQTCRPDDERSSAHSRLQHLLVPHLMHVVPHSCSTHTANLSHRDFHDGFPSRIFAFQRRQQTAST